MKISDFTDSTSDFKTCCTAFYEYDLLQMLLGDSMHPGGIELTKELGRRLHLSPDDKVLDLASGLGTPAITLAEEFGSQIIGVDLSIKNVNQANTQAAKKGLSNVAFEAGDAEKLTFSDESFDVVISECSFCLFPNKEAAAQEIFRVLKPNGRLGITDVSLEKKLPREIQGMIFRVACIADALSLEGYRKEFAKAGFVDIRGEDRKDTVYKMIQEIKKKIFVAELAKGLKKIDLGDLDLQEAKKWLKRGKELVDDGYGTYVMITASKP
ncbi:MAG: methyltransferase domain-containing protein [Candidatus Hodarchaeales archaeon]|jgi:ubiquinone/menaquinone biosynthesis C-methylase UbiE